jgi:hypothetical protein
MFIGDWGRHIDNWRWAQFDSGKLNIYRPVPKDRDQTQAKFGGVLLNVIKTVAGLKQLQSFGEKIKDLRWYNFPAMEIDRRFTNEVSRQGWIDTAKALQRHLTDAVIEYGVKQLPPEIFAISGEQTIKYLKTRRDDLAEYAAEYYDFLSHKVEIPGTKQREFFHVKRLNDNETLVTVRKINKEGEIKDVPLYSRTFLKKETEEIRLYGIDGNDIFHIEGIVDDGISVRVIGGPGRDSIKDESSVKGRSHKTKYYDNPGSRINASPETKIRLADTIFIYPFDEKFKYDEKGTRVFPGLNPFYRIFVGIGHKKRVHGWREKPFKYERRYGINYSISENSFHPYYRASHPQIYANWNLSYNLGFDGIRRANFFGIGNETVNRSTSDEDYYRLRTSIFYADLRMDHPFAIHHNIGLDLFYNGVKVVPDEGQFVSKQNSLIDNSTFNWKHFAGSRIGYGYSNVNDELLPTKGFNFLATASYTVNIQDADRSFTNVAGNANLYIPLFRPFSIFLNTGAATLWGQPEFYQYNNVGSSITLRGFVRNRFYGKTVFYQQNELRWLPEVRSYLFNGKAGLIALYDIGRVWNPGENSTKWHSAIGGGLTIAPFNKVAATVYYSVSKEEGRFNFRIGGFF